MTSIADDARLTALLERSGEIEYMLDTFGALLKRGPDIADNVNRAIGEVRGKIGGESGSLDRLVNALGKLETLSESPGFQRLTATLENPEMADALVGLIDQVSRITAMIQGIELLLARAPQIADNINSIVTQMRDQASGRAGEAIKHLGSIDPRQLVQLLNDLFIVVESPQTRALLSSSVFLDQSVKLVDEAAKSAVEASPEAAKPAAPIGIFGMLSMLKNPDVQRTLQFGFAFARKFGQKLAENK
jgi:uncharacterized protein YjgD (DUF1641 family)